MASPATLNLTLSPSNFPHVSPELFNPKPDWSLQDLKEELDALSLKFKVTPTQEHIPSPNSVASYSFSWRELSVAADFGRAGRPFKICAFDDGSDSEDDDGSSAQSKERFDDISISQSKVSDTNANGQHSSYGKNGSAEVRDTHLSALQRDHEQRSQVEERKLRKEAEARKREILAREERERQEKLKAEAEAKRKADAILAAESERKKKAEAAAAAALQRAEAERLVKSTQESSAREQVTQKTAVSSVSSEAKITTEPKPIVSKAAADLEHMRHGKLREMLEASRSLQMNTALKKVLKDQERILTKLLQQVSATQEQVRTRSVNLIKELAPSPQQPFTITTFASKLMSQCEIQVSKLPSFAFALAQVVVNISSQFPEVMEAVLATMNQVCIFTVPKYYVFKKSQFENDRAYFKVCGYKEEDGKLESTDEYAARMTAYVTLYAAITQAETDGGASPYGLKEGWAWCARLLNSLPADRLTASALEAFLRVAGFKLCRVYNKSFMKMLNVISTEFIRTLKQQDDADSRAVVSRLETYIATGQYLKEPEGFRMPRTDLSSGFK